MMNGARIEWREAGLLQLSGTLDYRTAPQLLKQGLALLAARKSSLVRLDCAQVSFSSSVGLALLLAFMREAARSGGGLEIINLPFELKEIAQVYGVVELLPLAG